MSNINILQNVVVDKQKIAELIKDADNREIKQLLGIKDSQLHNLKRGERGPSSDGLLRLMMRYQVSADDLATVK